MQAMRERGRGRIVQRGSKIDATGLVRFAGHPQRIWTDALLVHGHTNREVADRLSLSVKTVETHRARLSEKLGLRSRADLVRFAIELGLLQR